MPRLSHIPEFFGLRRSTIGMLFMVILVGMGERMAERFLPIYLIAIGGSVLSIGLLNGLDNLLSALYAYPEEIWRTNPESAYHGFCAVRLQSRHVRPVLSYT